MEKKDTKEYLESLSYVGETIEQTQERLDKKRAKRLLKLNNKNNEQENKKI